MCAARSVTTTATTASAPAPACLHSLHRASRQSQRLRAYVHRAARIVLCCLTCTYMRQCNAVTLPACPPPTRADASHPHVLTPSPIHQTRRSQSPLSWLRRAARCTRAPDPARWGRAVAARRGGTVAHDRSSLQEAASARMLRRIRRARRSGLKKIFKPRARASGAIGRKGSAARQRLRAEATGGDRGRRDPYRTTARPCSRPTALVTWPLSHCALSRESPIVTGELRETWPCTYCMPISPRCTYALSMRLTLHVRCSLYAVLRGIHPPVPVA